MANIDVLLANIMYKIGEIGLLKDPLASAVYIVYWQSVNLSVNSQSVMKKQLFFGALWHSLNRYIDPCPPPLQKCPNLRQFIYSSKQIWAAPYPPPHFWAMPKFKLLIFKKSFPKASA